MRKRFIQLVSCIIDFHIKNMSDAYRDMGTFILVFLFSTVTKCNSKELVH